MFDKLILICIVIIIIYVLLNIDTLYFTFNMAIQMYEKQQWMRIIDICILGPFLIYVGYKLYHKEKLPEIIPYLLILYGLGSIVFNFMNYVKNIK